MDSTMKTEDWLTIGRIVAPQGLRGEVRVYPETDFPERFEEPGQRWLLRPQATEPEAITLEFGRFLPNKNLYVVQFAEIEDRTAAEELRGAQVLVPAADRPELAPGEFHYLDLVGLTVIDQASGQVLGTVVNLIAAGNDLLEIERSPDWLPTPEAAPYSPEPSPKAETPKAAKARAKKAKASAKAKSLPRLLIPFVESIVPVVDIPNQRLEITPPPGLLDL